MQCNAGKGYLLFSELKSGLYSTNTQQHTIEETTNAFAQQQGRKKERERVVIPV